jgi:preprotein translocase subunit SecE
VIAGGRAEGALPDPFTIAHNGFRMAEQTRTSPRDFMVEVVEQIKKVTWPDWPQLKNSTGVIAVFMLAVSAIIFGMDFIVRNVLEVISSLFIG